MTSTMPTGGWAPPGIVFHVGFPKTGSTALQRHVFPYMTKTVFIGRDGRFGRLYEAFSTNLRFAGDDDFTAAPLRCLVRVAAEDRLNVLVSDETLAGTMYVGAGEAERTADRLRLVAPDARILLCVRRQDDMLRSLYALYVQKGGYLPFHRFIANQARGFSLNLDQLCYDEAVVRFQVRFGPNAVKTVAYEHLVNEPDLFLEEICGFVGTPTGAHAQVPTRENTSLSPPAMAVLRSFNRLARRSPFNPRPPFGDHHWVRNLRRKLQRVEDIRRSRGYVPSYDGRGLDGVVERYRDSNRRLAELTGLPLGDLGYAI